MRKRLSIKILLLALGLSLIPITAHTLPIIPRDYPHNTANTIECVRCHFIKNLALPWSDHFPVDIDDTPWNQLCLSCHLDKLDAPPTKKTHSSIQLGDKYGDADNDTVPGWSIECKTCHLPHQQDQILAYGAAGYLDTGTSEDIQPDVPQQGQSQLIDTDKVWVGNQFKGMLLIVDRSLVHPFSFNYVIIENTSDTITVKQTIPIGGESISGVLTTVEDYAIVYGKLIKDKITTPNSGVKDVKLFRTEGQFSFADNMGADIDGICEVCHTQTENPETGSSRFRNVAHNDVHNDALNCVQCHIHREGFQNNCNLCHGYPPIDPGTLVFDPGPTGSLTAGAHYQHTNMKQFECKGCHFGSVGLGDEHDNSLTITMGFSLFGGAVLGGTYNGQPLPVQYNTATGNPTGTIVTNAGTYACNTIYCHSNANPFEKTNQYQTPVWTGAAMTCTSCHKAATDATYGLSGRHMRHTADNYSFYCEVCHVLTADIDTDPPEPDTNIIKGESAANNRYHVNNVKDVIFAAGGDTYLGPTNTCDSTYCHSNAREDSPRTAPLTTVQWDDTETGPGHSPCNLCHQGRPGMGEGEPMNTDGHGRLVDDVCMQGSPLYDGCIREYPCYYCHDNTVKDDGSLDIDSYTTHLTGSESDDDDGATNRIDIDINPLWNIDSMITYDSSLVPKYENDSCMNVYCHSDGTSKHLPDDGAPISVREFSWTSPTKGCNACHGHEDNTCENCHTARSFAPEDGWLSAMPMYANRPDISKFNSHFRHLFTGFSCQDCHYKTVTGGACDDCHTSLVPTGAMGEAQHVDPFWHVDGEPNVFFADGGNWPGDYTCDSTVCHTGTPPTWGGDVDDDALVCLECHGDVGPDVDNYLFDDGKRGLINTIEWLTTGHGRTSGVYDSGRADKITYPGNPPANFPGNPCWYCHDNNVLHNDMSNPFRLLMHNQYAKRFEKECVFCHMKNEESECISCHYTTEPTSAPQVGVDPTYTSHGSVLYTDSCNVTGCHDTGLNPHTDAAGIWTQGQKDEVKMQYLNMGVCLKCHEEDAAGQCTQCHAPAPNIVQNHGFKFEAKQRHTSSELNEPDGTGPNWTDYWTQLGAESGENEWKLGQGYSDNKFEVGYDGGKGFVTAVASKAQSSHFGYRHYNAYEASVAAPDISGTASVTAPDGGELTDAGGPGTPWSLASEVRQGGIKYKCITSHNASASNKPGEVNNDWQVYWRKLGKDEGTDTWVDTTPYDASQWRGKYVKMMDGPNNGESRPIDDNDGDTLFLERDFTNPVIFNNSYIIYSPVWKGGKFCWDCHDPHGDSNLFMIQDWVATETDGTFGIPTQTKHVIFDNRDDPDNYARSTNDDGGTEDYYERICNVCHSDDNPADPMHYRFDFGDTHRDVRRCVECHEHRFTDSHASGQSCTTANCHDNNRPVPRHTGFGLPRDCVKCHDGVVENRMNIMGQFREGKSHHVQTDDKEVTNKHCYACHWEANFVGLISLDVINDGSGDRIAHEGYDYLQHTTVGNAKVDLVIWGPGTRPDDAVSPMDSDQYDTSAGDEVNVEIDGVITKYRCLSSHTSTADDKPGVGEDWKLYWQDIGSTLDADNWLSGTDYSAPTAVTFLASDLIVSDAAERAQVSNVTPHCLGCHDYKNNETKVFDIVDVDNGDCRTPNQYAWDGTGVGERYNNVYTTEWGKYSQSEYDNVNARNTTIKAYSAHGNAAANDGGWDAADGWDETVASTRAGSQNVQCYDCHSSHGSKVTGPTSSYVTFDGSYNGANLKETQFAAGGYYIDYAAGKNVTGVNPYQAGADQCFDCHEVEEGKPVNVPSSPQVTPWGYKSTFGATEPILGYYDSERMAGVYTDKHGIRTRYPYKQGNDGLGGHLHASSKTKDGGTADGPSSNITIVDGSKSWGSDFWVRHVVRMVDGSNAGEYRRIRTNDLSSITFDAFDNPVSSGEQYEIVSLIDKESGTSTNAGTSKIQVEDSSMVSIWAVDEWIGYYVTFTSGNNAGQVRKIVNNTTTALIIDDTATPNVESFGYEIEKEDYKIVPYAKPIGGLCAPCHDPHGVSPTLGEDMAYAVPLLKGTWLTSPYKEDLAPLQYDGNDNGETLGDDSSFYNRCQDGGVGTNWCSPKPYPQREPQEPGVWRTDRNTFNTVKLDQRQNSPLIAGSSWDTIDEDETKFAGLCLLCHPQDVLADEVGVPIPDVDDSAPFRSVNRIHTTVKGWGDGNEHTFSCSKCHQPHSSGLGKLMVTNCLQYEHRGRDNLNPGKPYEGQWNDSNFRWWYGNYPEGWPNRSSKGVRTSACHGAAGANGSGGWPDNWRWNDVTPW